MKYCWFLRKNTYICSWDLFALNSQITSGYLRILPVTWFWIPFLNIIVRDHISLLSLNILCTSLIFHQSLCWNWCVKLMKILWQSSQVLVGCLVCCFCLLISLFTFCSLECGPPGSSLWQVFFSCHLLCKRGLSCLCLLLSSLLVPVCITVIQMCAPFNSWRNCRVLCLHWLLWLPTSETWKH